MPAMLRSERDRWILSILRTEGSASAVTLADRLHVSPATIRRDLERLNRSGALSRVYGGATLSDGPGFPHGPGLPDGPGPGIGPRADGGDAPDDGPRGDDDRGGGAAGTVGAGAVDVEEEPFGAVTGHEDAADKERLAAAAASLVTDGDVLLLDIGTTVYRLARHLHGRPVTVITSNMAVFDELRDDPEVELVLLGGVYRRNYRTLVGSLTEGVLDKISAERLFLSCTGVRGDGQVVDDIQAEASVKRAMIDAAESVVLLAHHDKFPGRGPWRVCGLREVDLVVTTERTEQEWLGAYEQANGKVMIA